MSLTLTTFGAHNLAITLGAPATASLSITDNDTATVSVANVNDGVESSTPTDGKFRVKMDRTITGTINGGGTEATFKTYNGAIYIRKKK